MANKYPCWDGAARSTPGHSHPRLWVEAALGGTTRRPHHHPAHAHEGSTRWSWRHTSAWRGLERLRYRVEVRGVDTTINSPCGSAAAHVARIEAHVVNDGRVLLHCGSAPDDTMLS